AFLTLWECLVTLSQLTAPYTPFIADEIYTNLTATLGKGAADSVHLSDWPAPVDERVDDGLRRRMGLVRRLVTLGRSARTDAKMRVRQPLARALVVIPAAETSDLAGLEALVAEELNVKSLEVLTGVGELVTYTVKPNFKALGPRFGPRVKEIAAALAQSDPHRIVVDVEGTGTTTIDVGGESVELGRVDLDVRVEGRSGFALAQEGAYGVALDLDLSPELIAEGIAREVVRGIQDLRKATGLAVEDRIELYMSSGEAVVAGALDTHRDAIAAEVLATNTHVGEERPGGLSADEIALDQGRVKVALKKA
ncbi:MAG: DUF5915 domain-containing protein, partial [Actinomycetota bacterium]